MAMKFHSTSLHSFHVFLLFAVRTRPIREPPSIAVLEQLARPRKRMASMPPPSAAGADSDQVPSLHASSQFVNLLPQFVHSAASRHARFTVRVLGHWTVPSYLSDIPSDRRRNHHLLHLLPVALARSLAGSSIIDLDCLLCVYHTSAVLV